MTVVAGLLADLARERDAYAQLLALLEREAGLLGNGDVDALAAVARDKETAAEGLTALAARRDQFLASAANPQHLTLSAWIAARPAAERQALEKAWKGLLAAAKQARTRNDDNGLMIRVHGRHIDERLEALMRLAGETTGTYGRDGLAPAGPPGRLRGRG